MVWVLEYYDYWFQNANLGELFAIIGFALGIILSQKIGSTYGKFLEVEDTVVRLSATLRSLTNILDKLQPQLGTKACHAWAKKFLNLLEDPKANSYEINQVNTELYQVIAQAEEAPAELAVLHGDICRDAAYCLSKKTRLMPHAYDTLLHQATMLYLFLIAVFIPGATGLISVVAAAYILYGMYNLTQDFDSVLGGEFNLINIDISEFQTLVKENKTG